MKKKVKIYLAGPLFTDAEIRERREEAEKLRMLGFEVYSPIEQNDDIGFDPDELYRRDIVAMEECDIAVVALDNLDSGTMGELGWFVAREKKVYSVWSNWKYPSPNNIFIRGLAINQGNKMFKSIGELYQYFSSVKDNIELV